MKGLEALEIIKKFEIFGSNLNTDKFLGKEISIIEKELREKADIDNILNDGGGIWATNGIVSKKLKALEIIRTKYIDLLYLQSRYVDLKRYNNHMEHVFAGEKLTEEEWDLLRGALINE